MKMKYNAFFKKKSLKKKMNSKADSRMISPWLFLILGIIGVAIAVGVFAYFSGNADIRVNEAKAMSDKLIYGISDNGYLKEEAKLSSYNILNEAGIDYKSMDNGGFFYFNVAIYKGDELKVSFLKGNGDFEIQCRLNGEKLAKCYYREFFLSDKNSELYKIKILTGSNNRGNLN
jgi:hypothetical protein